MNSLKINNQGDLVIEDGDLVLVGEIEDIRQGIFSRLSINKREWFLNLDLGLDYDEIAGKKKTDGLSIYFEETILDDERIRDVHIEVLELDNKTRHLTVEGYCTLYDDREIEFNFEEVEI